MRRKDALLVSYFAGASSILIIFGAFFMFITSSDGED
jgi:hypothetical protein